ncbi:hypothetical protein ISF_05673 [Cordyceps fumosorosea ARSEF 2679]|uniref:Uncharacterized protein n=1 Tax=Cordyceps fumosorosea (strain ARSEF 2679) TaxID=1081104 RepID=A0A167TIJ6_CORFA|nr:hypothetical protein ISF_05673 [Cordyceps fumosorosea ARSEF 2679]OAA60634.1 hypothetical protein ISF_05673 [Cordyceps fumosorosea ARSEF 2679]
MGTIQLPAVAIISQQTGLQADLRTALRFSQDVPENVRIRCADDITRLRTEEKLWIVPATPCRIRISIQLLGRVSSQILDMREAASWIERCDIWERLWLRNGLSDDTETFLIKDDSPTVCIDYDALEGTPPFAAGDFTEAVAIGGGGWKQMSGSTDDMIEFGSDFFTMEAYFDM